MTGRFRPALRALLTALPLLAASGAAGAQTVFLSTQMRPIEEAQRMREVLLKAYPGKVDFVTEQPQQLNLRVQAEQTGGTHTISLIGALHGEIQSLAAQNLLEPADALAAQLHARGIPDKLLDLAKFGGQHVMYVPWMQATYIMVANKQALPYLPPGAKLDSLTYDQLAAWGQAIQAATGKRVLGFPAGPSGLMHRFFEGFLYPAYTGGVVTTFKSPAAVKMWGEFAALWKSVNPNSASYNFMQEPLLAGDVWIGFDHVARMMDALRQKPDDFVAFPAPAGPKGRAYMPVIVGFALPKGAPDAAGAAALVNYFDSSPTQILTARTAGFFPVIAAELPSDLDAGTRLAVDAISRTQGAPDALPVLLPGGLGTRGGEFDKVFLDSFQLIVLRGQKPETVLEREAAAMTRILDETQAPCWAPDPASTGACKVQ